MRGLLAAVVVFAVLFSTCEATGIERRKAKRHGSSNAAIQTEAPKQMVPSQGKRSNRATSMGSTFRAEDIVPDICKGCSS